MGAHQLHSSSNAAASVFAWLLNVSSSVAIVFVNKVLMDQRGKYRFTFGELRQTHTAVMPLAGKHSSCVPWHISPVQRPYIQLTPIHCCLLYFLRICAACTLSAIHFLTAAACIKGAQLFKPAEEAAPRLPWRGEHYASQINTKHIIMQRFTRAGI
jgi:hypothetical protein